MPVSLSKLTEGHPWACAEDLTGDRLLPGPLHLGLGGGSIVRMVCTPVLWNKIRQRPKGWQRPKRTPLGNPQQTGRPGSPPTAPLSSRAPAAPHYPLLSASLPLARQTQCQPSSLNSGAPSNQLTGPMARQPMQFPSPGRAGRQWWVCGAGKHFPPRLSLQAIPGLALEACKHAGCFSHRGASRH